jgi:hypothetical protein
MAPGAISPRTAGRRHDHASRAGSISDARGIRRIRTDDHSGTDQCRYRQGARERHQEREADWPGAGRPEDRGYNPLACQRERYSQNGAIMRGRIEYRATGKSRNDGPNVIKALSQRTGTPLGVLRSAGSPAISPQAAASFSACPRFSRRSVGFRQTRLARPRRAPGRTHC